jgi:hypothetical protein
MGCGSGENHSAAEAHQGHEFDHTILNPHLGLADFTDAVDNLMERYG